MNAEQMAQDLIAKFIRLKSLSYSDSIKASLIVVNTLIESHTEHYESNESMEWMRKPIKFWKAVKKQVKQRK